MSVRLQTQTLLSRAWRSQNADCCSLRGKIIEGRRMMASKLNCRCQSLPCSCPPAFPCVPGQREEMLVMQEGGKESRKTRKQPQCSHPHPRAVGPARRDHNTSPVPILSVPAQSLQHTDTGNVPRD